MQELEHGASRLEGLTDTEAANWLKVGRLLLELEQISPADAAGRPWQEALLERLQALGQAMSPGHLYKMRRAAKFLVEHAPEGVDESTLEEAPISAVEVAERMYRLDPDEGLQALTDALPPRPKSYLDLKERYDALRKEKPHLLSARQLAWKNRRAGSPDKSASSQTETTPLQTPTGQRLNPPSELEQEFERLMKRTWAEAWRAAEAQWRPLLTEKEKEITALKTELRLLRESQRQSYRGSDRS